MSPYFSPKSICAPSRRASSIGVSNVRTARLRNTCSFTSRSTSVRSSTLSACSCVKSKRSLSGRTAEPACATCSPSTSPQRLVQEVRRRVVRHRREAHRPGHDRLHAVARRESLAFEDEHLVVAEPDRLAQLGARARLLVLDPARVGDLPAAGRIERRALELRLELAVAEVVQREDRRQHLGPVVADEVGRRPGQAARRRVCPRCARSRGARPSARGSRPRRPAARARPRAP